jgi:2,3-bisphosphoglycerate-dependent phosphoglycerate mutase
VSILLVRHGETAGNVERVLQRPDVPLNERGQRQATQVAERLASHRVGRVLSSDLTRAVMTAEAICARLGMRATFSPLLAERNFGELRGRPYDSLAGNPFAPGFAPPGGESWDAFHARVAEAFPWLVQAADACAEDLVVVTHGLMCRAIVQRHLRLGEQQALPDRFNNTGITAFDPHPPHRVTLLDCAAHLSTEAMRSGAGGGAA